MLSLRPELDEDGEEYYADEPNKNGHRLPPIQQEGRYCTRTTSITKTLEKKCFHSQHLYVHIARDCSSRGLI